MLGDPGSIPGLGRSLGEGNGNHPSILAGGILWTEEPGGLQSKGLQRVRHDRVTEQQELDTEASPWERTISEHKLVQNAIFSAWLSAPSVLLTFLFKTSSCYCLVSKLCPILCDPMDCFPPASFVYGIFQARMLEWVVISSSRGSSWIRDRTHSSCTGRQIPSH